MYKKIFDPHRVCVCLWDRTFCFLVFTRILLIFVSHIRAQVAESEKFTRYLAYQLRFLIFVKENIIMIIVRGPTAFLFQAERLFGCLVVSLHTKRGGISFSEKSELWICANIDSVAVFPRNSCVCGDVSARVCTKNTNEGDFIQLLLVAAAWLIRVRGILDPPRGLGFQSSAADLCFTILSSTLQVCHHIVQKQCVRVKLLSLVCWFFYSPFLSPFLTSYSFHIPFSVSQFYFIFVCFSQCQAFDLTTINDSHDFFCFLLFCHFFSFFVFFFKQVVCVCWLLFLLILFSRNFCFCIGLFYHFTFSELDQFGEKNYCLQVKRIFEHWKFTNIGKKSNK